MHGIHMKAHDLSSRVLFASKMRNYIGQKCEQSLYLNPKLSP